MEHQHHHNTYPLAHLNFRAIWLRCSTSLFYAEVKKDAAVFAQRLRCSEYQTSHPHAQKHFIGNAIENPRNDALKGLHNPAQGNAMGKFKTTFAA